MNVPLIIAGLATAVAAVGHSVTGEQGVIRPMLRAPMAGVDTSRIRLGWHLSTIAFLGIALVFLLAAAGSVDAGTHRDVRHLALALGVAAAAALVAGRGRNPAGYLFAVAAVSAWLGA